jgi:hypothetical protein
MPPDHAQQELQDLYKRRQELVDMRKCEKQHHQHPRYHDLQGSLERMLDGLDAEIAGIKARIQAMITDNEQLQA